MSPGSRKLSCRGTQGSNGCAKLLAGRPPGKRSATGCAWLRSVPPSQRDQSLMIVQAKNGQQAATVRRLPLDPVAEMKMLLLATPQVAAVAIVLIASVEQTLWCNSDALDEH